MYFTHWVKNKSSTGRKNELTASLPIEQICFTFRVLILLFLWCTTKLYYSKSGLHFHFLAGSSRFPTGWPVWPSDFGYELIMRKVVPFPTCFSYFWRLFQRPSVGLRFWGMNFCRFGEMACELFLLLVSRSLHRCIQSSYSGLTIGGNVFLPLIKVHRVKFGRHIWWLMVAVVIAKVSLSLDCKT